MIRAVSLKAEHLNKPLGISEPSPVLSWITEDGVSCAFEIIASVHGTTVYESGKIISGKMQHRCGYAAKEKERVDWKVRVYDEEGNVSDWAASFYETGILTREGWCADWIEPELVRHDDMRMPASVLHRTFNVQTPGNARLYITCHGMYEACINGHRAGDFVLAPGVDDYRKRLQVQTYDVSDLLVSGKNTITVTIGDGLYRGNNGVDGLHHYYGSDLALLCQLENDGIPVCISNAQWEASQNGPVRENDMQLGETYDARKEDITDWHAVKKADHSYAVLTGTDSVPVCEQQRFPGNILHTSNGETVIDFGQNLAGYTEFTINAREGQKIVLWHGETLDENGNFTQSNFDPGERNKNGGVPQKITYICKDGKNTYKPHFALFGFRYAKIETDIDLHDAEFAAIAVYSAIEQTAFFECGNSDVNRLFENSLWSMRSNFNDIPTDCPTRERAGWTGDAGVFAPTGVILADCWSVFAKWLRECRLAQHDDGCVSNIAPVNTGGGKISEMLQGSAGWGDACILVPWALYEAYGDDTILSENYDMMQKWLSFTEKRAEKTRLGNLKNPYHKYLVDHGFHFGEWMEPDVSSMDTMKKTMMHGAPEVATAYFYRSASLMAKIAAILGKDANAAYYRELAENVRNAYRYCCVKDGEIHSDRQCEYVRPLAFGLLNENEAQKAADALAAMIRSNGYHLNTGFLSTAHLCDVLADHGHADTAYKLLLQEDCPGWLYAVKKGATSIWETWDGIREDGTVHDSLNHYSYGAVSGWLIRGVCGIHLSADGLVIAPTPSRALGYAKAEYHSPRGTIRSAWEYKEDRLIVQISVPCHAKIILPEEEKQIEAGEYTYEVLL